MDERGALIAPKSRAGRRRVPIVAALRDVLTEYRADGTAEGFVFGASPEGPFTPSAVYRRVRTAWRHADLKPIGLHEARHTFASVLIAAGVNAKAITTYMGHSSVQVKFDLYGKLMPGNEQEAVALVDAYLERADTRSRVSQLW